MQTVRFHCFVELYTCFLCGYFVFVLVCCNYCLETQIIKKKKHPFSKPLVLCGVIGNAGVDPSISGSRQDLK